jgi:hypothetical protein
MNWLERWRAISARIEGVVAAAGYLVGALRVNSSDTYTITPILVDELRAIAAELKQFLAEFEQELPAVAAAAIKEYEQRYPLGTPGHASADLQIFAQIAMLRTRVEYLMVDTELEARNLTEFALDHLKRLIAVDELTRQKWIEAFPDEVACERLGAVHLLGHRIWAFKARGRDSETDLVYDEPLLARAGSLRRTSAAIVLTEWKVVREVSKIESIAVTTRTQAQSYAAGVLGGLELKHTRYIVLVGEKDQEPPGDIKDGTVTYRHIWLSVDPDTPSISARRRQTRRRGTSR